MLLKDKKYAYVDVETTGLDPDVHEIIQVAILIEHPQIGVINTFVSKFKPQHIETAHPKALAINGYADHPELWDDAPILDHEWASKITTLLMDCILVGQNVGFDRSFLQKALKKFDLWDWVGHHTIDTASLALEHLTPIGVKSVSLRNTCSLLGVSNKNEHDALADVIRCREVFKKLNRAGVMKRLWWWFQNKRQG